LSREFIYIYINLAVGVRTIFRASIDLQIAISPVAIAQSKSYNYSRKVRTR